MSDKKRVGSLQRKGNRITLTCRKTLAYTRSYTGWSEGDCRGLVTHEKDVSAESAAQAKAPWFSKEDVNAGGSSDSKE